MQLEPIYSLKNPRIREWAALKQKKYRDQTGQYLIEGVRLVEEALQSDCDLEYILYNNDRMNERLHDLVAEIETRGLNLVECTEQVLAQVADTKTPQGIVAIAKKSQTSIDFAAADRAKPVILVDGMQDPGNLGTIIRTADAVDACAVIVSENTVDPYHPKVVRATMGSLFHLPVRELPVTQAIEQMKERGFQMIGSSSHNGEDYFRADLTGPLALIVGSEAHGISSELDAYVDSWVCLPMLGKAESLNAAIAASVMMYEVVRQKSIKNETV
ncbi:RNA methyltransferase [Fodinisporobacter ferrooxydans]|uniref:RNA methyltransferase n=1 Tax=Fodinisporobacter ferrooxydans TaxID=2901836 RepID=A0ABY4CQM4_9BACL|nr:RNA methyltransferase [Alicyclobacillaceae bacterium MYW30-H2]